MAQWLERGIANVHVVGSTAAHARVFVGFVLLGSRP